MFVIFVVVKFSLKFFIVMPCAFVLCVRNLFLAQARGERKWRVNLNCHSGNIMLFGKNKSIVWTCTLYEAHFYRDSKTHSALIFEFCMHLWTYHFQSVGQMSAFLTDLGVTYKGFHLESEHRHLNRVPPQWVRLEQTPSYNEHLFCHLFFYLNCSRHYFMCSYWCSCLGLLSF